MSLVVRWVVHWPSGSGDNEAGSTKLLVVNCPSDSGGHEVWSVKLSLSSPTAKSMGAERIGPIVYSPVGANCLVATVD